jgi:hypothetical protein
MAAMARTLSLKGALPRFSRAAFVSMTQPSPVNGITFEEWAAGNARLANEQPLADVLAVLNVDQAKWNKANQAFLNALQQGDPASYTLAHYAEVFANPAVGRFKEHTEQAKLQGKLVTFVAYARVQAHLTVASEFGKDPQSILKEHNLTVYEFSQEAGHWVQATASAAGTRKIEKMNHIREKFEADYRAQYEREANN